MATVGLTQAEADALMAVEKVRADTKTWDYPLEGDGLTIPLTCRRQRELFSLDLKRYSISLIRYKYQTRSREVHILARLEFGGPPHRNPDGEELPCPHLHLYRHGFADKWAFPVPSESFPNLHDRHSALEDFMRYCNIVEPPRIVRGLFA